jgi:hypothetical protein
MWTETPERASAALISPYRYFIRVAASEAVERLLFPAAA